MEVTLSTTQLFALTPKECLSINEEVLIPLIAQDANHAVWSDYSMEVGSEKLTPPSSPSSSPLHSTDSAAAPMLPPCRVCSEKASGFHYGANTCEACKGFFRRSLQRKENYRCTGSGNCDILPGKRSVCAACRYQKCLQVGMSKQAIKTGRYTHEKKTKDIQEVKRLQYQQKLNNEGRSEQILADLADPDFEHIIHHLTDVHLQQTHHTAEFFQQLPMKEKEFLEQRSLQKKVFGTMKPLPHHEYLKIYQTTGMDVDGRRAMLMHMIPCIEKAVKRFISFAKALPGFKDLPIDDQIALIKGSRFEGWLLSAYKAFNREHNIFTHVCGYTLHIDEMARLYDFGFLEKVFAVADKLRRESLSIEEDCVIRGLLILSRDRCALKEPGRVEHYQSIMLEALEYLRVKTRPHDRLFTARLVSVLVELRSLTDLHQRQESKIGTEWCTDIKIPPLLYEMFSV